MIKDRKLSMTPLTKEGVERLAEMFPEIILWDGLDGALIGVAERCGMDPVAAYDYGECIRILRDQSDMSQEDAVEYFEFNVLGAYVGEKTPIVVTGFTGEKYG